MDKTIKKQKLNIAIVVDAFPALSETFIVNQIADLIERGHNITILSFNKGNFEKIQPVLTKYSLLEKTVFFTFCPPTRFDRLRLLFAVIKNKPSSIQWHLLFSCFNFFAHGKKSLDLSLVYLCQWFLNREPFDVIHAHYGHNGAFIADIKAHGLLKECKLVVSFHGYDIWPSKIADFKKKYINLPKQASLLIANTEYTKEILGKIFDDLSKVVIIPVGLDTNYFKKKSDAPSASIFNIVFCGRMVECKAPQRVVEIGRLLLTHFNLHNFKVVMIGDGHLLAETKQLAESYGMKEYFVFMGAQSQDVVRDTMDHSHVFLLPGTYEIENQNAETQGLVVQEAQSMGLPVIVSDAGGTKYGLIEGETGFVVKETDIAGFAEKIAFLINNPIVRQTMSANAIAFIQENYDSTVLGTTLEALYYKSV